ncbi:hypothetical protein, partial [Microbacterium sp. UBA6741]
MTSASGTDSSHRRTIVDLQIGIIGFGARSTLQEEVHRPGHGS